MILKNKFCRSVDLATFTPPLTKIPGSAPGFRKSEATFALTNGFSLNFCHLKKTIFSICA